MPVPSQRTQSAAAQKQSGRSNTTGLGVLERTRRTLSAPAPGYYNCLILLPSSPHSSDSERASFTTSLGRTASSPCEKPAGSVPQVSQAPSSRSVTAPSLPTVPVVNLAQLIQITNRYLSNRHSETEPTYLHCTPSTYHEFAYCIAAQPAESPSEPPLLYEQLDNLHYTYSIRTHLLTLKQMPTRVHNCLQGFIMKAIYTQPVITEQERSKLQLETGSSVDIPGVGTKEPDFAISLKGHKNAEFPMVVFEVAFSQPYRDLLADANEWLVGTNGLTRMCVVVSIEENRVELNRIKNKARDEHHTSNPEDSEDGQTEDTQRPVSPGTMIANSENMKNTISVSSYVGPLTAYLEAYVLDRTTSPPSIKLASPRLTILPPPSVLSTLRLVIARNTLGFPPAQDSPARNALDDQFVIDLSAYPTELIEASKTLAMQRMRKEQTKRKRNLGQNKEDAEEWMESKKKQKK